MNILVIVGIVAVAVVAVGATMYFVTITPQNNNLDNTTTTQTPTTTENVESTTSMTSSDLVDIVGAWHGVYNGSRGSGRWSFLIWRTGENKYSGLLRTDGAYSTGSGSVPISITLQGDKITFGSVALGVTFTGTVSGDSMSGTWSMNNGYDSGTWSGVRGRNDLTPDKTITTTSSKTPVSTTTTTQTNGSSDLFDNTVESSYPSGDYGVILHDLRDVLASVKGGAKLVLAINSQYGYLDAMFLIKNPVNNPINDLNAIVNNLTIRNYSVVIQPMMVNATSGYTQLLVKINSTNYSIAIIVSSNPENNENHYVYVRIART